MRMMLKVVIPVDAGNKTIKDGSLPRILEATVARLKPEGAYFYPEDGKRTMLFFFNMADVSQIPAIVEPLFMGLNASLSMVPVMNGDDLKKGLAEAAKNL